MTGIFMNLSGQPKLSSDWAYLILHGVECLLFMHDSLCMGYFLYSLKTAVRAASIFVAFMLCGSKTKLLNLTRETLHATGNVWCMALGTKGTMWLNWWRTFYLCICLYRCKFCSAQDLSILLFAIHFSLTYLNVNFGSKIHRQVELYQVMIYYSTLWQHSRFLARLGVRYEPDICKNWIWNLLIVENKRRINHSYKWGPKSWSWRTHILINIYSEGTTMYLMYRLIWIGVINKTDLLTRDSQN